MINNNYELLNRYEAYKKVVGEATFVDIARSTDPACSNQPWDALRMIIKHTGVPKILQIWTKSPRGVLRKGRDLLEECRFNGCIILCQLTVNGYGTLIEPKVPFPVDWDGIDTMIEFLKTPQAVLWRYDPVIPGISDLKTFRSLAENFSRRGITRGTYNWVETGMEVVQKRLSPFYEQIDLSLDKKRFSFELEHIANEYGIDFMLLAETERLDAELRVVSRGSWQYEWLTEIGDEFPLRDFMPGALRGGCMCAHSFDVGIEGQFEDCHKCVYCFAR
jgi:hypothetical protein